MKLSKSKLSLAKVINENGGWADDSVYAANDEGGIICGYSSKPIRRKTTPYHWSGSEQNTWIRGIKTPQWHQCVLSREEYYQSYPNVDADGWIEWSGGECPVDEDDRIDVKFSDGDTLFDVDSNWDWSGGVDMCNIIAYRLHKPGLANPTPEAKPTIEQLASDYRNAKDYADRKQQEADAAKADAEAKLTQLVAAGKTLGLVLSVVGVEPESELVITDWRDLQVDDLIWYGGDDELSYGEYYVMKIESPDYEGYRTVMVNGVNGGHWIDTREGWGFIRRP